MKEMYSITGCVVFLLTLCKCTVSGNANSEYKRVCYYTNWSQYRPGVGRYTPDNINPKLCTHIIYAFAKVINSEIKTVEWNDDQMFEKFKQMKDSNPGLKTLIAVGGWNAASSEFTVMVESRQNRQKFIDSTLTFLRNYGFDGLDLDWEYPTQRGGRPQDKQNLVLLVKELKRAFSRDGYLLTAAVPAGKGHIDNGYDVTTLALNLDFINLMTYDLHGAWDKVTGENSPLFPSSKDAGDGRQLNMKWAAEYWVSLGVPKSKLVIGMATYGRTFRLADAGHNDLGAPATGPGQTGTFTREAGFLSYYEICTMEESGQGQTRWDDEQKVPYYVNGNLWVGYDNVNSITGKVVWLKNEGYGGAMVWALDLDDFRQVCKSSDRPYPLLSTIYDQLVSDNLPTEPTRITTINTQKTTDTVTTTARTTTPDHGKEFSCANRADDFYPDPSSCSHFYRCVNHTPFQFACPPNLYWNPTMKYCDWKENVNCRLDYFGY